MNINIIKLLVNLICDNFIFNSQVDEDFFSDSFLLYQKET